MKMAIIPLAVPGSSLIANANQITNLNLSNPPSDGSYREHYDVSQCGSSMSAKNQLSCKATSHAPVKQDIGF